jgi:hypothetical protein
MFAGETLSELASSDSVLIESFSSLGAALGDFMLLHDLALALTLLSAVPLLLGLPAPWELTVLSNPALKVGFCD